MASLILTVVGPDRPGLVRAIAEAVAARGGSWLESRMARLAGQFAGIVLVEAPESAGRSPRTGGAGTAHHGSVRLARRGRRRDGAAAGAGSGR